MIENNAPLISICIPAYKRTNYVKRLLDSIAEQTFTDFEVILSDDSDDDSVEQLSQQYIKNFSLAYHRNKPSLGTPANWNFGISRAHGEWIKLMHDDDWFATPDSLLQFANATSFKKKFIFSAYTNYFEGKTTTESVKLTNFWKQNIKKDAAVLIAKNVIGPPSVTMVHKTITEKYDERLKWRVDTDFYERILRQENEFFYIDETLICVGISESQVTQSCLYITGSRVAGRLDFTGKIWSFFFKKYTGLRCLVAFIEEHEYKERTTVAPLHKTEVATNYFAPD